MTEGVLSFSELLGMSVVDLIALLSERRKELMNLRFQKVSGQVQNTARVTFARKEVARILTALKQKEANNA